jgi:membrane protein required for colicin V production
MGTFDIVTGIIILLFLLKGLKNGFIIELASLAALAAGLLAAVLFSEMVGQWLNDYITTRFMPVLAFVVVFIGVVIVVHLIARAIDRLVKAIALGWLNRLAGAAFGALKAALLISIVLLLLDAFGLSQRWFTPELKNSSYLYTPLEKLAPTTLDLINVKVDHLLPNYNAQPDQNSTTV